VLAVAVLVGFSALPHKPAAILANRSAPFVDADLYKNVVTRVSSGQDYYSAAAAENRAHRYPTTPAPVFREPWLAWLLAALRFDVLRDAVLLSVSFVVEGLFFRELIRSGLGPVGVVAAFALFATGVSITAQYGAPYLHEVWAAFLIALSLMVYRADRWVIAVGLGFTACLFRELAAPYLLVMAAFALHERRWREFAAWVGATIIFGIVFAAHLALASGLHRPGDLSSPGWLGLGGIPFMVASSRWNVLLQYLPDPPVALAICLSIIGLAGWRDPRASRAALVVGGYMAAFNVVGRPDTSYWGQLCTPLLAMGLVLSPVAARDLVRSALTPPAVAARSPLTRQP
jgi:hypothetical protein